MAPKVERVNNLKCKFHPIYLFKINKMRLIIHDFHALLMDLPFSHLLFTLDFLVIELFTYNIF